MGVSGTQWEEFLIEWKGDQGKERGYTIEEEVWQGQGRKHNYACMY